MTLAVNSDNERVEQVPDGISVLQGDDHLREEMYTQQPSALSHKEVWTCSPPICLISWHLLFSPLRIASFSQPYHRPLIPSALSHSFLTDFTYFCLARSTFFPFVTYDRVASVPYYASDGKWLSELEEEIKRVRSLLLTDLREHRWCHAALLDTYGPLATKLP